MRLAIIITIYNRLHLALRLIDKLHDQLENEGKLDRAQVICINDGSTEELVFEKPIEVVCKEYGFEYYKQKNGGEANARNAGLDKVETEYFTYVDCDDDITDDYVKNVFSELGDNEHLIAFKWVFKDSGAICDWHDKPLVNWNVWSYLFRTDYFKQFRFDETMIVASDYDYIKRAVEAKPDMYIRYAPNKTTIIYNANNPQNLTNKFGRGEVKAKKGEK